MRVVLEYQFRQEGGKWVMVACLPRTVWHTDAGARDGVARHSAWCADKCPSEPFRHESYPADAHVSPFYWDGSGHGWQYVVECVNSGCAEFRLDTVYA